MSGLTRGNPFFIKFNIQSNLPQGTLVGAEIKIWMLDPATNRIHLIDLSRSQGTVVIESESDRHMAGYCVVPPINIQNSGTVRIRYKLQVLPIGAYAFIHNDSVIID